MFRLTNYPNFILLIGAISVNKVLTSVNLIVESDAITFEAFIIRKLVLKLWKDGCVVRHHLSTDRGKEVEKAI